MSRGRFFTFEGIDGSGLTTQAAMLKNWLSNFGYEVFLTKEPSGGPIGALIRLSLSNRLEMSRKTRAFAFAADRMDHLVTDVLPKMQDGINVISDRYYLSSYAYQSTEKDEVTDTKIDLNWIMQINSTFLRPDLTILLSVPPVICIKRMQRMRWHVEIYENEKELEEVSQSFLSIAQKLRAKGERIEIIDGNRPIKAVHSEIVEKVKELLKGKERRKAKFNHLTSQTKLVAKFQE